MNETDDRNPDLEQAVADHSSRSRIFVVLFAVWIINIVWSLQVGAWTTLTVQLGSETAPWLWVTWAQVALIALPLFPFARRWRQIRYQSIFRMWLYATLFPLLLAPARLLAATNSQAILLVQYLAATIALSIIMRLTRREGPAGPAVTRSYWLATLVALLVALPWLAWNALGSPLDIFLGLLMGLLFGMTTAVLTSRLWLHSLSHDSRGLGWDMLTGGLVIGTTILIMASALGFNGVQLLAMTVLPALGWALMGVAVTGRSGRTPGNSPALVLLSGLAAAAVIIFTDSDGLTLGLFDGILRWAWQTAFASMLLALAAGFIIILLRRRLSMIDGRSRLLPALTVGLLLFSLVVAVRSQLTGFHGDSLFVILKTDADVSAAAQIDDYDARRQFVYDTLTNHAEQEQAELRQLLDGLGVDYTPYYLANALEVRGGLLHRSLLTLHPDVDRVLPSPALRPVIADLAPPGLAAARPNEPDWNLTLIEADRVWRELGITGEGIIVGQSDSGVQWDHPELADGYLGGAGRHDGYWLDPWQGSGEPNDLSGHGTATLGSAVGNQVGVAPGADWFACANLHRGLGNPALYLDCMQFMLAPYPQQGDPFHDGRPTLSAHVLNNSWGCPQKFEGCDAASLQTAVAALRAAGLFVVAAAGNSGPDCSSVDDPIAIYDEILTVGAVDSHSDIASFSSRGPVRADGSGRTKPDIVAPGVAVVSAAPGDAYTEADGTSLAGPHVTGVVALMWSANSALIGDIDTTEAILLASSTPLPATAVANADCFTPPALDAVPNNVSGYGLLNAFAAVEMALNTP